MNFVQTPEEKSAELPSNADKQEQSLELPAAWHQFLEAVARQYGSREKQGE
ncbi:hypothetical protein BRE01_05400 [Brevibacillus reuszeri]|uniref:Uncharacterized protein n=1 Tax=Brevibacillus reuszeri TaxID=54915 RepID=A0ABQ0TFY5_9BACL|nr:hypothetical protein [Brevibacillus reuszeri]MED1857335.1 hypothetical protein [Brevibacillus reuszeri]GED66838.1 hypothetical protein BRE01_05400 [Brevibacillus reuszeri]